MDEIKKEYSLLFNGITDTINQLEKTIQRLRVLQQKAEEACLESEDWNDAGTEA